MGQPVADLGGALLSARERGIAFDEAWRRAMNGRNGEWREALTATRDGWARAYAGAEPTGAELALIACGTSHWGHRFSIDGPRHCGYCDSPFAPENEQQKFCSPSCKRAAAHDRHNRRRTSNPMPNTTLARTPAGHDLLRIGEVADLCRVTPATIRAWVREGRLPVVAVTSKTHLYRRRDVEALLNGSSAAEDSRSG